MEQTLFTSPHVLPILIITIIFFFLFLFPSTAAQTCQKTCGDLPLRYPFGSGSGCGDPRFHPSITCNDHQQPTFTTHTGSYPISHIDYANQVLYISDPTMSTCACNQPSKGFGLDWDAPFAFHGHTIFALLDCSSASPVYAPNGMFNDGNNSSRASLCDSRGLPICGFLYGCKPIVSLNIPMSGCCVYTPVNFGPSFEMDLEKLKCGSYSGFYSFNGRESEAESWKYGIALKYKFAIDNVYPSWCSSCEESGGVCGYSYSGTVADSFICNCPAGFNTTTNCFFGASYNAASNLLPNQQPWIWLIIFSGWLLVWSSKQ